MGNRVSAEFDIGTAGKYLSAKRLSGLFQTLHIELQDNVNDLDLGGLEHTSS